MESINKSDDRSQTLLRGVGRLSFLLLSDQNVEQKKNEKKRHDVEIDEVLLNRENNAHNHHHRLISR